MGCQGQLSEEDLEVRLTELASDLNTRTPNAHGKAHKSCLNTRTPNTIGSVTPSYPSVTSITQSTFRRLIYIFKQRV